MRKILRKKLNNRGNTFVVILVTIACMGILIGAIMASMGYFYRMRFVDLENKNNFYYVEKAMDDIYTGIGSDSVTELMRAYESTVEVMVYYDAAAGRFVTIDEGAANEIMKQKFLRNLVESDKYASQQDLYNTLQSYISVSDVTLQDPAGLSVSQPRLYLEVVTTTDDAGKTIYDKLVIHNVSVSRTTDEGYVQSITTDIEIAEPEFNVSFSNVNGKTNALYDFALLADMGIEFNRATTENQAVSITGNVYAAADYYNKNYNSDTDLKKHVSSYYNGADENASRLSACNGWTENSRYSGIYVNASNVNIMADKVIVPGSISVMNDANLSIIGNRVAGKTTAEVWADGIVMAPSFVRTTGMKFGGGSLSMYADAYIADDFEINEDAAEIELVGNYYGYNFSQTADNTRVLSQYAQNSKAHYNSSAIIVNGNGANLDLSGLGELYVAGRSYISTTTIRQSSVAPDGSSSTVSYIEWEDGDVRNVDVRTGESISLKTNQMAYMPLGIYEENGEQIPKFTNDHLAFNRTVYDYMRDPARDWLGTPAVVSQSVSGNTYYFLNFKSARAATEFLSWYVDKEHGLSTLPGYELAKDIVDITAYTDNLTDIDLGTGVDAVNVTTSGAYTTGVVNVAQGRRLGINAPGFSGDIINGESESATITNFNARATEYNNNYMEMKYALELIDVGEHSPYTGEELTQMQALKNSIVSMSGENVTPINYYLDTTKIDGSSMAGGVQIGNAYVWISDGDIEVKAPSGTNGNVLGLIIAKGDVTFTDDPTATGDEIKRFEGLVISGSKIKVDHQMDFVANAEIVKTILRTADATKGNTLGDYSDICQIFKDYTAESDDSDTEANVGNIELGDILRYNNWKKNVQ